MDQAAVDSIKGKHEIVFDATLVDKQEELVSELKSATGLIVRNRTIVNAKLLDHAPDLKVVGRLGVGLDNISLPECEKRGIRVIPATGCNDQSVAEYVICCAMLLLRKAYLSSDLTVAGKWPRSDMIGFELAGKVFGFIGWGAIAKETALRAKAFNCPMIAYDPYVSDDDPSWGDCRKVSLEELFKTADVISLHVPLNAGTKNLINAESIAQMKKTSIIINAARGGVVDEHALVARLKEKAIHGAAIDVFEQEPIVGERAALFQGVDNLLLTPHIAGVTAESNVRVSAMIATEVSNELLKLRGYHV